MENYLSKKKQSRTKVSNRFAGAVLPLLFAGLVIGLPDTAEAKRNCTCDVSCQSSDGTNFSSSTTWRVSSLRRGKFDCVNKCNDFVKNQLEKNAKEGSVCGKLTCSGTYKLGWQAKKPAGTHSRDFENSSWCQSAGDGGTACCPPHFGKSELVNLFIHVQNRPSDPYRWQYNRFAASSASAGSASYNDRMLTTLAAANAIDRSITKLAVGYYLYDTTTGPWTLKDVFHVSYIYPNTVATPPVMSFSSPNGLMQINRHYRIIATYGLFDDNNDAVDSYWSSDCPANFVKRGQFDDDTVRNSGMKAMTEAEFMDYVQTQEKELEDSDIRHIELEFDDEQILLEEMRPRIEELSSRENEISD